MSASVLVSLAAAVLAAVCYGVATVLQAVAARRATHEAGPAAQARPLVVRVLRQWLFVAGTLLDLAGFVAQFVALRDLPVFAVEAAQAANLAVTAVVAVPLLGLRPTRREWAAVGAVCVGLALLGVSAGTEGPSHVPGEFRWGLVGAVAAVALAGGCATRLRPGLRGHALGLVAGLGFGVVALAARAVTDLSPAALVADPAVYAVVAAGAVTLTVYASALQHGVVTAVASAVVVGETVVPAVVGVVALGDHARGGFVPVAVAGFVVAVAGAALLSRFGEPPETNEAPGAVGTGEVARAVEPPTGGTTATDGASAGVSPGRGHTADPPPGEVSPRVR